MSYSSTYCPLENKLRLYSTSRLDAETYARVKAAGFRFAPKQECFYAPAWSPEREDLLLDLCGEIGDEDTSLVERASVRAERFEDYSEKRGTEAEQASESVQHLMDGIPLGQPILIGHHSERHARKDAERIESGMRKAVSLWQTSQYWQARAKGALRHAKYKERPDVRARRIKTLEAEQRKYQRNYDEAAHRLALWSKDMLTLAQARFIANVCHMIVCEVDGSQWSAWDVLRPDEERYTRCPAWTVEQVQARAQELYPPYLVICQRWLDHYDHRLTYERTLLTDAGGTEADQTKPEKGGAVRSWVSRHHAEWLTIQKVNKVSVSLLDNWDNGGANFTRTVPFDKLHGLMSRAAVEAKREACLVRDNAHGTGFFLLDTPSPPSTLRLPVPEAEHITAMQATLKAGIQVAVVEQLFPTPPELAARMAQLADIKSGERVLEPSAGTGTLLAAMPRDAEKVAVELNQALTDRLVQTAPHGTFVVHADFLTSTPDGLGTFDAILMNPPFVKGADIAHVTHALQFLRPGGRLVALMSAGVSFRTDKAHTAFRALLEAHHATIEPLPADTFKDSGTGVHTVLVFLTLPVPMP